MNNSKAAYRRLILLNSQTAGAKIAEYRQKNRKPDGTRFSWKEAAEMLSREMESKIIENKNHEQIQS